MSAVAGLFDLSSANMAIVIDATTVVVRHSEAAHEQGIVQAPHHGPRPVGEDRFHFFNSVVQFVTMISDSGGGSAVGSRTMNRWPSDVTTY